MTAASILLNGDYEFHSISTDIADKDLKELRNKRWEQAFNVAANASQNDINRKATIVIEHLIQASDISHTMQHWYVFVCRSLYCHSNTTFSNVSIFSQSIRRHVYRKWNEAFFEENWKGKPLYGEPWFQIACAIAHLSIFVRHTNTSTYKDGRAEKCPSEYWYKGEIGFFEVSSSSIDVVLLYSLQSVNLIPLFTSIMPPCSSTLSHWRKN